MYEHIPEIFTIFCRKINFEVMYFMKSYSANEIRNVAILGHSGCGKTTIAEACLHVSGVTKRFGRTEEGNTVSDYDPEEIKRKVSINASIIPVEWLDEKINFIDTPGYFDFEGEVRQELAVADLALIVVNGKSGIEVGTEKAWELAKNRNEPKIESAHLLYACPNDWSVHRV